MYRGIVSVRQISIYAKHLPRGCAVYEYLGGAAALTAETMTGWDQEQLLAQIIWQNGGGKGQRPKPRPMPAGLKAEKDKIRKAEQQALAWRRKHLDN